MSRHLCQSGLIKRRRFHIYYCVSHWDAYTVSINGRSYFLYIQILNPLFNVICVLGAVKNLFVSCLRSNKIQTAESTRLPDCFDLFLCQQYALALLAIRFSIPPCISISHTSFSTSSTIMQHTILNNKCPNRQMS